MAQVIIEIFRAGRHVSASGEVVTFSDADLDQIAQSYDPSLHEAPLVVGHPKSDAAPAYGWAKDLLRKGSALKAVVGDVDADFAEGCLEKKHYKKVSASFYRPSSPNNPTPGKFHLRHIGLLGAQPPAVKGLKDASFADGEDCLTFADGEESETQAIADAVNAGTPLATLRAWIIKMFGQSNADEAIPLAVTTQAVGTTPSASTDLAEVADVIEVVEKIPDLTPEQLAALKEHIAKAFEEAAKTPTVTATDGASATVDASESFSRREAAIARREAQVEADARRADRNRFLDGLARKGIVLPVSRAMALSFLELLGGDDTVSFGEGEACKPERVFRERFLAKLPKQVEFNEVSADDFADGDDSPQTMARRVADYQAAEAAKGNVISTIQAMNAVKGR